MQSPRIWKMALNPGMRSKMFKINLDKVEEDVREFLKEKGAKNFAIHAEENAPMNRLEITIHIPILTLKGVVDHEEDTTRR